MWPYLRREGGDYPHAQSAEGEILGAVRGWARELRVRILAGSFAERAAGESRIYNTSALVSPPGEVEAVYRKMHLFDVELGSEGGGSFRESAGVARGKQVAAAATGLGGIGLSLCYGRRFPQRYRALSARGARILCVPSAFTPHTGKDHWEVLLRARAIENLAFVVAPAQCGRHSPERASHGRSLIVDPWGVVLAQLGDRPGIAVADCDLEEQERMRKRLPALDHRRL